MSKAKGGGVSQEKALGHSSQTAEGHGHFLAGQPLVSCFPICKLEIMRLCCENQMRSRINTLAQNVTHSKCSRNVSYSRNVRYKTNTPRDSSGEHFLSSKGQSKL